MAPDAARSPSCVYWMPVQHLGIMLVRQGFKFALRLKAQKEAVLRRSAGCRRFVYNEALAHQISPKLLREARVLATRHSAHVCPN